MINNMEEHILKLIELSPKIGYYELSMTFGLSLGDLLKILDITNYKIKDKYMLIYNDNDKLTYKEESNGYWF